MTPKTNKEMVESLRKEGVLKSEKLRRAFLGIDRAKFLTDEQKGHAYDDNALPTLAGQTISQPYTVAFMLDLLEVGAGQKALDVGSGSGWTTALLAHLVGEHGSVIGTEIVPELVDFGKRSLEKFNLPHAEIRQAEAGSLGVPDQKFDRILVGASATRTPHELLLQLEEKGVLVCPVKESIVKYERLNDDEVKTTEYPGFVFVPLI